MRATLSNITDRRKGMQALRESEARFRAITEASPLGVYVTDAHEKCIFANANFQHICGLRADALRANGYLAAVHPDDRAAPARDARGGPPQPHAVSRRATAMCIADGSQTWTRVDGAPIRDGNSFLGFVQVVEDITASAPRTRRCGAARSACSSRWTARATRCSTGTCAAASCT